MRSAMEWTLAAGGDAAEDSAWRMHWSSSGTATGISAKAAPGSPGCLPRHPTPETSDRAWALYGIGTMASVQADYPATQSAFQSSLAMHRTFDDRLGILYATNGLALLAMVRGDMLEARALSKRHEASLKHWASGISWPTHWSIWVP